MRSVTNWGCRKAEIPSGGPIGKSHEETPEPDPGHTGGGKFNVIRIKLNGKPRVLDDCLTVERLLQVLKLNQNHIAIAVNYDVIPHQEFTCRNLKDGDEIDIIRPTQGG